MQHRHNTFITFTIIKSSSPHFVLHSSSDIWINHIYCTIILPSAWTWIIYRGFKERGQRYMSRLYKSIVLPHLDYCCCIWDQPHKTYIDMLESVQSLAAHIVTNDASVTEFFMVLLSLSSFFQPHPQRCFSHKNSSPLYCLFVRTQHLTSSTR